MAMRAFASATAVILILLLLAAPAARADRTTTQNLPPGATISSAADATPSDPVQVQITAPKGGTTSIKEVDDPPRSKTKYSELFGPRFDIVPARSSCQPSAYCPFYVDQRLTVTVTFDTSILPGAGRQTRVQDLVVPHLTRDGAPWTEDENPIAGSNLPLFLESGTTLANGDLRFTARVATTDLEDNGLQTGHVGSLQFTRFKFSAELILPRPNKGYTLTGLLHRGFTAIADCRWACTMDGVVSVSKKVARKLKLKSTTLLKLSGLGSKPKTFRLPKKVRRALDDYSRVPIIFTYDADAVGQVAGTDHGSRTITFTDPDDDLG